MVDKRMRKRNLEYAQCVGIYKAVKAGEFKQKQQEMIEYREAKKEVEEYIIKKLKEGKNRDSISKGVYFIFGRKHTKYSQYFGDWIDTTMRVNCVKKEQSIKDGEER